MQAASEINSLIAKAMPATAARVREYRARLGDEFVTQCVRRGLAGEAGWFFAREGCLAVGVPWSDTDQDMLRLFDLHLAAPGSAFVLMRSPEAAASVT